MNYDKYGFPIFDDEYISDVAKMTVEEKKRFLDGNVTVTINGINIPKDIVEFYNNDETKIIKEMTGLPVKEKKPKIESLF